MENNEKKEKKGKNVVEVAQAVAEAVKLCEPGVIPVYPITPQTHVSETLAKMKADGDLSGEMIRVESEQSAISACIGAQATGVQAYTATSSQGLALMHEILFIVSGMRLPVVMTVVNRSLSAPLSIWNDQQDSISQRDTGWIQLHVEDGQEAFDTQIQAFKIAQETKLPVMVCLDGFVLSHVYEPVEFLTKEQVKKFVPDYKPEISLNPSKPVSMGTLGTPEYYIQFRKQLQDAINQSKETITKVNREFASAFGRSYGNGLIETVNLKGKKHALISIGSVAGTARKLIEKENIGLIKIKSLRPFPADDIAKACEGLESVGVIEKDISLGGNGAIYDEVKAALYRAENRPKVSGFIAGIGGRDINLNDMEVILKKIKSGKEGTEWVM
ncbi:pyruvate ferredoxin oxidoreductase [Candidatus Aenigmatarchaeota archaeon]